MSLPDTPFSTYDRDNDVSSYNCAENFTGTRLNLQHTGIGFESFIFLSYNVSSQQRK